MDSLIENGNKYSLLDFKKLITTKGFDNVHDSIAQLSDSNGYFTIDELGVIELSWDENASTVCKYDDDDYTIAEFLTLVKNLSEEKATKIKEISSIFKKISSKKEISLGKIIEELKCEHIDIAVYDKNDELSSLIYKIEDFDDNKDIVAKSDELSYVSDIIHNIYECYNAVGGEDIVNKGINYLADIIIMDKTRKMNLEESETPLNKIMEQYDNSLAKDTSLEEAKQLVEKDNLPTPKLQKHR